MPEMSIKRTILLVDDNPINLKILTKILNIDYNTVCANNGKEALEILKSHPISLVVLDIIMPIMDGYEILKRIRSDEALKNIPVIVASGAQKIEDINVEEKSLMLGANDYITKPYISNILKRRIENVLYIQDTSHLVTMVKHDVLTRLYSKEYFYIKAENILKQNPDKKYDLICCDIERFKVVNDLYGIETGDNLLKSCAEIFKKEIAETGICGRIGPDVYAFLVLHQNTYHMNFFKNSIEQINDINIDLNIEVKFGVYIIDDTNEPLSIMCDRAKLAVNSIKGKYGVVYQYYDNNIRDHLLEEQYLITHMKEALGKKEFEVFFQPKYEIKSSTIVGAEALVRWNDPLKGYLPPDSFIPLFEKNGFITELDKYVWEDSLKFLKNSMDNEQMLVPISINVSRTDLFNPNIDKFLSHLTNKYKINPKFIHLEITESAYTDNPNQLIDTVTRLKSLGFKIDMDDFGTGYSSLNMLSDLPIDVLKLDIGFMKNKEQENNKSILSFIISLAKWLNLDVVAEGVETKEQVELLKSLGCNVVQGYYYSKPLKQNKFKSLLQCQQIEQKDSIKSANSIESIKKSSILLICEDQDDIESFQHIFKGLYSVCTVDYSCKLNELFKEHKQSIELAILNFSEKLSDDIIKQYVLICRQHSIPVIVALPNKDKVEKAISLGATDFLTKPFQKISTLNRVNVIIKNAILSEESLEHEISNAISKMKKRAEQDSLTGLLNRAEFETQVQAQLSDINVNHSFFIMLDIDNFKKVNDTLGHKAGDNALKALADFLHKLFCSNDIIGRMGGDEFSVFIPSCVNKIELENRVDKLCHSFLLNINNMTITCSAGICLTRDSKLDFLSLYENADRALLFAKQSGKGQYCFYQRGMEMPFESSLERNAIVLLDGTSDATFVCDANTGKIIYINDSACKMIGKDKKSCIGLKCYEAFWDRCHNCERCTLIDNCINCFYEEDTIMKDGVTPIHIKAKMASWAGRDVKIHYLHLLN